MCGAFFRVVCGGLCRPIVRRLFLAEKSFALRALTSQFPGAAHGFCAFAGPLFRWLFEIVAAFHFAEDTLPLKLLLEDLQCLIDIVVTDDDLNDSSLSLDCAGRTRNFLRYKDNISGVDHQRRAYITGVCPCLHSS